MAKTQSGANVVLHGARGLLAGQIVIRKRTDGSFILAARPTRPEGWEPTAAQLQQQQHFSAAVQYAQAMQSDPEYVAAAENLPNVSPFNIAMRDFLKSPTLLPGDVDLSGYSGQVGDTITMVPSDDFNVANVHLVLSVSGGEIESGDAVEAAPGWTYTAAAAANAGDLVVIDITVTDKAGNTAITQVTKQL